MAVEADLQDVERLLTESNKTCVDEPPAVIGCFNGPRSFTLSGSNRSIDAVAETFLKQFSFSSMRTKKLNVSNAFHSTLVDPLMTSLEEIAQDLRFKDPSIPIERATEFSSHGRLRSRYVAEHMRFPVYFNQAVQRLAKQFPSCVWLEAGSNSTVTSMASRALGSPAVSHFQSLNITSDNALDNLTDATVSLWKAGVKVSFWQHHFSQTHNYKHLLLPPYQFDKARHWLELKKPITAVAEKAKQPETHVETLPEGLLTFVRYLDNTDRCAQFRVNTMIPKYKRLVSGHVVAETAPICPATVQVDLAIEGIRSIRPGLLDSGHEPQVQGVENQSPICIDPDRSVWLEVTALGRDGHTWDFKMISTGSQKGSLTTTHTTGNVVFCATNDLQIQLEFARYERLVGHRRCSDILQCTDADDVIQGRNIYKTFAEIVDYGHDYRGLKKLVGRGTESAGHVVKSYNQETWLDAHLSDCFCQVGGIWVNCMTDRAPTDIFIANGIEKWARSPKLRQVDSRPDTWDVFAYHHQSSDKAYLTDIFIFSGTTGALMEVILGINYVKIPKISMSKLLSRLTGVNIEPSIAVSKPKDIRLHQTEAKSGPPPPRPPKTGKMPKPKSDKKQSLQSDVSIKVKAILAELSGLDFGDIKDDSELANIGIDSLMGMELAREIEGTLKCSLPTEQLVEITDLPGLMRCVHAVLGSDSICSNESDDMKDSDEDDPISNNPSIFTPSDSDTNDTSVSGADVFEYLAEFLGLDREEIKAGAILRDLGVDSLLSTELRSEIAAKYEVHIPEELALEDLTIDQLELKVKGSSSHSNHIAGNMKLITPQMDTIDSAGVPVVSTKNPPASPSNDLQVPAAKVLEAFGETKLLTDQFIADFQCADYVEAVIPRQTEMCVALTIEAFEELGCSLRTAEAGKHLERIKHLPQHERLVDYLYLMLEKEGRLINVNNGCIIRTAIDVPSRSSIEILQSLLSRFPDHNGANKLTHYAGKNLAQILSGKTDGIKLIFGSEEGRELVSGLYGDWPLNKMYYKMMEDFLSRLVSKLKMHQGPLKILEMGAGTGGTTKWLVPLLASLKVPVEYTFTDLAPSFVASARKRFKMYPFLKFRTHDIEKGPEEDLLNSQHVVIASNAVHATHSLTVSTTNIRKFLRPDGFLMMLEMTGTLYWVDMIFGLFEGWWLFDDGRTHAVTNESRWEKDLQSVGYGHVDWTDGARAENKVERFFIALASGSRYDRLPLSSNPQPMKSLSADSKARKVVVDEYVRNRTADFAAPARNPSIITSHPLASCVLITGATGSVGSHLVAHLSRLPEVKSIICVNRRSKQDPHQRQEQALISKGILLDQESLAKLKVLESNTSKPNLGLSQSDYEEILSKVTHIVHNAWLMSAKLPLRGFEAQFQIMRNMIDLAGDVSTHRPEGTKVTFEFVSSIATVGHYPLWSNSPYVPEERVTIESVLTNGYGDAKYVCELMLDKTLHRYPNHFRTMAVRIGQIAGSSTSGYWNPMEHLSFLWKSSQTLKALPDFDGLLSWTPVNYVAATLSDLALADNMAYPIYHIDNPIRQPWRKMIPVLADALDIPRENTIPFGDWVQRVRHSPNLVSEDNPAAKLIDFLDDNFIRMSCGGLLLDTVKCREHSKTLAAVGPVSDDVARKFVKSWKDMKFLN